jgi:tetratricopeptide (TPR) repeat protein
MRALIDWSYDLLPYPYRCVFDDLAIFGNGSTLESAYEIGVGDIEKREDLFDILSSLVEKSLVVVDFDFTEARYTLLATTREYAREKLVERQRLNDLAQRHAKAYLRFAQRMDELGDKSLNRLWHAQARSELENWRIALQWALGEGHDAELGQRLVCALTAVWSSLALAEGLKWCRFALDAVGAATPRELVADLEYTGGFLAFLAGDLDAALPLTQRALDKYRSLDDHRGAVKAETVLGRVLYQLGRHEEAKMALTSALQTATGIGDPLLIAVAHQGLVLWAEDLDSARYHVDTACAIAKAECAKRVGLVVDLVSAEAHFRAGEKSAAIEIAKEALAEARELGDEFLVMRSLSSTSTYLLACDRHDESRDAAREALELSHLARGATTVIWTVQHLAAIAAARGDHASAARLYGFTRARLAELSAVGDFSEQSERQRLEAMLRSELAPSDLERLASAGGEISEAEAIEEAKTL